ncbi:MAG: putative Co/Zn/Cd efflux system membrane fusion protein [Cytophagales bacterium]|jgi:RND family efflux transporter MFP subunit|nr:efflux RND transporter periplasmic adaptor subunit [Bacteroidota bacterium]MBS1979852.1 efflux RND transporter periplasmic adaptor subunit [Bacteroidota bacterium]WHZ07138.1 MAG: putative Co/Zn/Cd efflux system membrane fusion protein [Cytophagales bacterium]
MKKNLAVFIGLFTIEILLNACGKKEKQTGHSVLDESAIAVQVAPVKYVEYSLPVISSGLISTETESKLSFKVSGIISRIFVKEGESVSKGQLLASLDLTEVNAQVSQAKNNLIKAQRDLDRGKRLLKDSAATQEQIQNLQTAYQVANDSYRIAVFNQQFSTIHANQSGKIIRKFLNAGELVMAGSPVLILNSAAQNEWIVKIGLPDVDWVRVKKEDRATITTDAYPNEPIEGELNVINEGADPVTGLYQAEVKIIPGNKKLASGLFAKVEIMPSAKKKLMTIPVEAVVEGQGQHAFVFVVNDDQTSVRKVPIVIAHLENKLAYISQGLDSIHEVVAGGSGFLTENSSVKINQH